MAEQVLPSQVVQSEFELQGNPLVAEVEQVLPTQCDVGHLDSLVEQEPSLQQTGVEEGQELTHCPLTQDWQEELQSPLVEHWLQSELDPQ